MIDPLGINLNLTKLSANDDAIQSPAKANFFELNPLVLLSIQMTNSMPIKTIIVDNEIQATSGSSLKKPTTSVKRVNKFNIFLLYFAKEKICLYPTL